MIRDMHQDLDPVTAYKVYNEAKEQGLYPSVDAFNNILSLLAGLGAPGLTYSIYIPL